MIYDFLKKYLTNIAYYDDYGLKYNYQPEEEINKITNNYSISVLKNKVLIKCTGDDAESFLNSQFTNDIKTLKDKNIILSGYCNPKGRIISIFYIFQIDKSYYLYTTLDSSKLLIDKLNMYKMMSKVDFTIIENELIGVKDVKNNSLNSVKPNIKKYSDNQDTIVFSIDNKSIILSINQKDIDKCIDLEKVNLLGYKAWDFCDIKNKIPFIYKKFIESFTPQMLSLDILNGVSFEKGCYPGQEIVARTHYLGKAKKALYYFEIMSSKEILIGDELKEVDNNKVCGHIVNVVCSGKNEYICLGSLRKESIKKSLLVYYGDKIEIIEEVLNNG